MYLSKQDLEQMHQLRRMNLINSVTGIKPANLIGTRSKDGVANLAIFSSVIHMGSHPALIGFMVRPGEEVRRHTFENIMATRCYTINHVHHSFTDRAHYTSAKFESDESEFLECGFTEEYIEGFKAPFVRESHLKLGMKCVHTIPIELNGTCLVIGEVIHVMLPDQGLEDEGHINLGEIGSVGISGLNSYYHLDKIATYPYARISELPWK